MPGSKEGGMKAAATNKARYGEYFYKTIGAAGGKVSRGGGFASNRDLAVEAGRKGGMASRRTADAVPRKRRKVAEPVQYEVLPKAKSVAMKAKPEPPANPLERAYVCPADGCTEAFYGVRSLQLHVKYMHENAKSEVVNEAIKEAHSWMGKLFGGKK